MRTGSIVILALILVTSGLAQKPATSKTVGQSNPAAAPAPAEAPSKEQLKKLFDVMEVQKQIASMVEAVGNSMEKMMPSGMAGLTEQQKTSMERLNKELYSKMMTPEFIDTYLEALIPIYQHHFTRSEVNDLIAFYKSPVGQKFLREQPLLTQESLDKVMPLMQKRVQEVLTDLDYEQRLREIFTHPNQTPPSDKN